MNPAGGSRFRPCPVCGGNKVRLLHTQRFALPEGHPLPAAYDVVACGACGFSYADTASTQEAYDSYYASFSKYTDAAHSTGGGASSWDAARLEDTARVIAAFEPDREARILDMGCAAGGMLRALAGMGFRRLAGVDPSPGCAEAAARLTGAETSVGTLFQIPPMGLFRGVILSHVMEHVRDLGKAMDNVAGLLEPGGWVYLEVPDATRYRECLVAPFQDFNTEHINHFSITGLANLLQSRGFEALDGGAKIILSAPGMPYPAVWRIGRKSKAPAGPGAPVPDRDLVAALESYVRESAELLRTLDTRLAAILRRHPRLIVWGAGQLLVKLLSDTCLGRADLAALVDVNPVHHGIKIHGVPVIPPDGLIGRQEAILVSSLINQEAILGSIGKLGISNPVFTLDKDWETNL